VPRMRLSEILELPPLKSRDVVVIGYYKSVEGREYAVLARRGQKVMPIPKTYHLVEVTADNPDPEIHPSVLRSIYDRFQYFEAISKLP